MMKIILQLLLFVLSLGFSTIVCAQSISRDVNASSGETLTNGDISITFVIGEAVGDLFSSSENGKYLTAGFAQPDVELKQILENNIDKSLIVYPNPTRSGLVKLAFNNIPDATYTIEVIDALGRVLQTKTVVYSNDNFLYVELDVSTLAKGIYFIRAKSNLNYQGQVKLIKI